MSDQRPIGVFDSGVGGLTVLSELINAMPGENFIYLGDTARVPYGARSRDIVQQYSREVADYVAGCDVKMLVVACNTASAHAEDMLGQELSIPVVGVIQPGVDALLSHTRNGRVGVIGTHSTIKSAEYEKRILLASNKMQVFSKACPLFVPLVEEGWLDKRITRLVIQEYLSEMVREDVDTVVLGCTHYPLLKNTINSEFPDLTLIDSSVEISRAVVKKMKESKLFSDEESGYLRICLTDITDKIRDLEKLISGVSFDTLEKVTLT